ncbi:MAG TPA: DNA-processing protein DprA [Chloroflexota bacterium]
MATVQPLEQREYNTLDAWLRVEQVPPDDLLHWEEGDLRRSGAPVDPSRLAALLGRGAAMALALESWTSRGLWILGRGDEVYPPRLRALGKAAPVLLYGAGDPGLLSDEQPALAVVGSRHVDQAAAEYTRAVGRACGRQGIKVVSGGARGVDREAMGAALEAGGTAVGVLSDGLARAAVSGDSLGPLTEGYLVLVSHVDPNAGFHVGTAMARNAYIYALADAALVVSATAGSGGTWQGATEALRGRQPPVFVRLEGDVPEGNARLLEEGAQVFPDPPWDDLAGWLHESHATFPDDPPHQQALLW